MGSFAHILLSVLPPKKLRGRDLSLYERACLRDYTSAMNEVPGVTIWRLLSHAVVFWRILDSVGAKRLIQCHARQEKTNGVQEVPGSDRLRQSTTRCANLDHA
jgi:hypothetical protein